MDNFERTTDQKIREINPPDLGFIPRLTDVDIL